MLNVYHFVFRQYGFEFRPSHQDLIFWEWMASTNRLEGYLKWKTANMLARAVGSLDLVECPFDLSRIPPLFDQYFHPSRLGLLSTDQGFHRMKLRRRSKVRYVKFCFSLYQSKAASLPAPEWKVAKEVSDTVDRLCTPKKINGVLGTPQGILSEEDVLASIRRVIDEICEDSPRPRERVLTHRLPSQGACLGGPRSQGGSLGYLVRNGMAAEFSLDSYLLTYHCYGWRVEEVRIARDPDDLRYALQNLRLQAHASQYVDCQPVGLVEPFKVRVITKGSLPEYHVARCWQPVLWRALREHPSFRLVGEKVSLAAVRWISNEMTPGEDSWLISGDYKQATDHIPSDIAEYCLEYLCQSLGVPHADRPVLLAALTRHRFDLGDGHYRLQESGQLMGSPISFPILCIYNAALTALALRTSHSSLRTARLADLPVLFNGDDVLFRGDLADYCNWRRVVEWGGLIPSVGKTLVSRSYGTINSTLYRFTPVSDHRGRWTNVERLPHLELQLAVGSMKAGRTDLDGQGYQSGSPLSLSRMWSEFMESAVDTERAWRFLWRANVKILYKWMRDFPSASICLPVAAGGLGFPLPPPSSEFYSTRLPGTRARMVARLLLERTDCERVERLRRRWLSSVEAECVSPSMGVLLSQHNDRLQRLGAPFVPRQDDDDLCLPPLELSTDVACDPVMESISTPRDKRKAVDKAIRHAVAALTSSGRGPWDLTAILDSRGHCRWAYVGGFYQNSGVSLRGDRL